MLPHIISPNQVGFVKTRDIHENVALVSELLHDLDRKTRGGNLILKIDLSKAYDRLNWNYLLCVMEKLGFSKQFRGVIG